MTCSCSESVTIAKQLNKIVICVPHLLKITIFTLKQLQKYIYNFLISDKNLNLRLTQGNT